MVQTDFAQISERLMPDCYPLPRNEDYIDQVGGAKFVTKLDLLKGYWQVPLTVVYSGYVQCLTGWYRQIYPSV